MTVRIQIQRKSYPARHGQPEHLALQDFHLELGQDEFVCMVGPSGCGKTTLLNLIAGLDQQFDGKIEKGEGKTGVVFQTPRLLPWRTVRENIDLALPQAEGEEWVAHLLEIMDLTRWQNQYPQKLSGGMARRAALVRAFAIRPDLLLMDEPFVSLDAPTARRIRQLLIKVWQERPHTVLFVTHDLREAITLADRLVFLTAAPTRVIHQVSVNIPRAEREEPNRLESFHYHLTQEHPELKGLL